MDTPTTFTPQIFAKLSPHPFLLANLHSPGKNAAATTNPTRANGRAPHQARTLKINATSLSHAHGSAMIRIGDTSVLCGVRGEILSVSNIPQWRKPPDKQVEGQNDEEEEEDERGWAGREARDYDLVVPNIELSTGCAPQFLPGVPPTTLAQTLSTRVYSLLHGAGVLDATSLRIWHTPLRSGGIGGDDDDDEEDPVGSARDAGGGEPEVKAYWTLYIDVLFISFDGNPFDAAWVAVLAALRDTKLPRAWWDPDREMVLCSRSETRPLRLVGLPVACTAAVLNEREMEVAGQGNKSFVLLDPDHLEEDLCEETITVVVDRSNGETRIRGISKTGGRVLGRREIREMISMAESRWEEFSKALALA